MVKRYFCALREELRALPNILLKYVNFVEGSTVVTPGSVAFCWCDEGRNQLEGKGL